MHTNIPVYKRLTTLYHWHTNRGYKVHHFNLNPDLYEQLKRNIRDIKGEPYFKLQNQEQVEIRSYGWIGEPGSYHFMAGSNQGYAAVSTTGILTVIK